MKSINVIVKDKNTLVLDEDANKGDYIDLTVLASIDHTNIESLIEAGKDKVYSLKLEEMKKTYLLDKEKELLQLKQEYQKQNSELMTNMSLLKKENENKLKLQEIEINKKYNDEINELKNKINGFENEKQNQLDRMDAKYKLEAQNAKNEANILYQKLEAAYKLEIEKLNNTIKQLNENQTKTIENEKLKLKEVYVDQINELSFKIKSLEQETKNAIETKELEQEKAITELKSGYEQKLQEKELAYLALQRQKAALNVKQTGEDLEAWCNNEMTSYMQNGFYNCTWTKDNLVIRDEEDQKGSKADYIFRVYASQEHNENEELASVCLDMKDENPDSIKRKTNSDYYKQLDKNRIKKNCKYAVLVSNLEMDKPNDSPIFKVLEYQDMYVVRPAYMMTFLNLITSLSVRFQNLILEGMKEKIELMNQINLKEEFDKLKNTYLDKPLEIMANHLKEIRQQSDNLRKISTKIDEECDSITKNYINSIEKKLSKFEIEINKAYKKSEKNNKIPETVH